MGEMPGIHVKAIPDKVFDIILKKQQDHRKQNKVKISLSHAVIMLLKEAYLKK